jgi:hypothetical protein
MKMSPEVHWQMNKQVSSPLPPPVGAKIHDEP